MTMIINVSIQYFCVMVDKDRRQDKCINMFLFLYFLKVSPQIFTKLNFKLYILNRKPFKRVTGGDTIFG